MHSFGAILRTSLILISLLHLVPYMVDGGFACLSSPCIHGVCLDDINLNSTYSCYCIDGYTGVECQTNWDECWSSPCQNGGVCLDGIATFNCSCPPGFLGDICEEDFNECVSNPCVNNGTCVDAPNGYSCNCQPGYSGVHCEVDVAVCNATEETRCSNGGVCQEGPGFTFSCKCPPGWTGFLCDVTIDECMSSPCQNGAICIDLQADYACACLFGFTGQNCNEVIMVCEDNPCRNSALCLMEEEHPVCYCVPDYHGDKCQYQYDECQLGPRCMNGGTCIDGVDNFTCSCPINLTGVLCECLIIADNRLDCTYISSTPSYNLTTDVYNPTIQTAITISVTEDNHTTLSTETNTLTYTGDLNNTSTTELLTLSTDYTIIVTSANSTISLNTSGSEFTTSILTETSSDTTEFTTISTQVTSYGETTVPNIFTSTTEFITETSTISDITTTQEIDSTTMEYTNLTNLPLTTYSTISSSISTNFPTVPTSVSTMPSTFSTFSSSIATDIETSTEFTTFIPRSTSEIITTPTTIYVFNNFTTELESSTADEVTSSTILKTTSEATSTSLPTVSILPIYSTTEVSTTEEITTEKTGSSTIETSTDSFSKTTYSTTYMTKDGRELNYTIQPEITTIWTSLTENNSPVEESTTTYHTTTEFVDVTTFIETTEFPQIITTEAPTTADYNFTVPPYFPDCTKKGNRCQNGGSCIYTSDGHRCSCLFDTDGPICENHLGIRNAAFGGDSFLSHKINDNSKILLEFKSKTTSSTGLMFYSYIDKTYMALYVEHGYLKFKFSCGYQTMLLSELGKPINNGYEMRINAELTFSKDFSHCNATIRLNNTVSMSGYQLALVDKFSRNNSWLYLGGIPNDYVRDKIQPGFIGCITALRILGKKINIFKDAEDGYEITECSSLACLSNPCQNSGVCVAHGESWDCHCKNGYSGLTCEISICDNNPCQFGGTCLTYAGSGYICLCPYGKHGHFCENDLQINKPYFSSSLHGYSSFVAYPIPQTIPARMEIKFQISPTTINQISILMFLGQKGRHDYYSDHMAVSFVKGYIMLTWNLGSGPRRIFTTKPIQSGKSSYMVHIGRFGRRSWLYVETLGNVTGRSPGNLAELNLFPMLYFGGHDSLNFSSLPHDLPLHTGFSGCISDIEFKLGDVILPLESSSQVVGRALGQCGSTECHERICQNDGACLYHGGTFTCLCQDDYFGPLCSSKENLCDAFRNNCQFGSTCVPLIASYACDCPIGKSGKYCEKDESLSDISFTGSRSYISLPPTGFALTMFHVEFEIRPLKNEGIVMFIGRSDTFLSVSIISGLLELRILPGRKRLMANQLLSVRSNKLLQLGDWHTVKLGIYGRKAYIFVNNIVNTGLLQTGEVINLSDSNIFIGGVPDLSSLPNEATPYLPAYYTGCFRKLTIDTKHIPLTAENIPISRNVQDCDGTPCGGDFCENGGTCWLDPNLKPHCSCHENFYGDKCESMQSCHENKCLNQGQCIHGYCRCNIGWYGAFCEKSIMVRVPKFKGNSYLIVNKLNKKRHTNMLTNVFLNFTTASQDGLLLWSQREDNFVGIGLEKGLLKIAYTTGVSKQQIEVPDTNILSDGLWHSLELSFKPFYLKVDSDVVDINNYDVKDEYLGSTDNYYLGGVPKSAENFKDITNIFHNNFEGCIQKFGTNKDYMVTDFSEFVGENIDVCQSF